MKRRHLATRALPFLTLALASASPVSTWASTFASPTRPLRRTGRLVQLSVVDRDGNTELPLYLHRGEYWVAGAQGARYALRVHNRQGGRVLTVMSVDGVNVVTGERAGVGQNGYVFSPGERADIAGWRKSDAQIAAFEFTVPEDAYASRTGRPDHLGVIGVAVFRERVEPPPAPPRILREDAAPSSGEAREPGANSARAETEAFADRARRRAAPAPQLGTGHGRREDAPITHTQFVRAQSTPDEVIRIRYDSHANLVARGVIAPPRPIRPTGPSPFPASPEASGYVPDPPPRW